MVGKNKWALPCHFAVFSPKSLSCQSQQVAGRATRKLVSQAKTAWATDDDAAGQVGRECNAMRGSVEAP